MANSELVKKTRKPQPKAGPFRLNTALKIAICHLLGNRQLSQEAIAGMLNCARETVARVARVMKQIPAELNLELEDYRRQLRTRVPVKKRIDVLAAVCDPKKVQSNPFAAMRGVEYVDSMLGLHPKVRDPNEQSPRDPAPMFNLPPGSKVQVNILTGPGDQSGRQIGGSKNGS